MTSPDEEDAASGEAALPEPLTPPDCDLRKFRFMPLDVARLRDSDIAASANAEVFQAFILALCACWHQVPAGSLPDDDTILCRLLGYGRDLKGWQAIRNGDALHGFIRCSDGRLYHPVVCEKANDAFGQLKQGEAKRLRHADQMRRWRNVPRQKESEPAATDDAEGSRDGSRDQPRDDHNDDPCPSRDLFEKEKEKEKEKNKGTSSPPRVRARGPAHADLPLPGWLPPDAWTDYCVYRTKIDAKAPWTEHAAKLAISKLSELRKVGDDPRAVIDQTILNGWKGLFQVSGRGGSAPREGRGDWLAREALGIDPANDAGGEPRFVRATVIDG